MFSGGSLSLLLPTFLTSNEMSKQADLAGLMETAITALRQGHLDKARSYVEKVLTLNNRQSKVWHVLSSIEAQAGNLIASRQAIKAALEIHPNNVEYLVTHARICRAQDDVMSAVGCLKRALDLDPKNVDALVLIGRCYKAQGLLPVAIDAIKTAVGLCESPELLNELGVLWQVSGDHQTALVCIKKALDLRPDYPAAYNNLGSIYLNTGEIDSAVAAFRMAVSQRHDYLLALNNLGLALKFQGNHLEALKVFDQALSLEPTDKELLCNRGSLLQSLGRLERAQNDYEAVLEQQADYERGVSGMAELHEWRGQYDSGLEILRHVDETNTSPELVTVKARLLRRVGDVETGIRLLSAFSHRTDLSSQTATQILFTLGDLHDSAGNYEAAFQCYQRANEKQVVKFDSEIHHTQILSLIESFSGATISHGSEHKPVFIVGMPRSGTSLAEQILAAHPQVCAEGERSTMGEIVTELQQEGLYPQDVSSLSEARVDELADRYFSQLGAQVATDKMPLNFLHLGLINLLFPEAKVIHCRRHPVDTALSCYFTNFVDPSLSFSNSLKKTVRYYRDYEALMTHWTQVLNLKTYELDYEALVTDADPVVRSLLRFLDLPWYDGCMEFHRLDRITKTASHAQVRQPIYQSSVGRYQNYAEFLGPLSELLP